MPLQPEKAISGNAARSFRRKRIQILTKEIYVPLKRKFMTLQKNASLLKTGRRIMSDNQFAQADDTLQASIIPARADKEKRPSQSSLGLKRSLSRLSLLSDSNQRPRDYKSRALAN